MAGELFAKVTSGAVRIHIEQRFPLDQPRPCRLQGNRGGRIGLVRKNPYLVERLPRFQKTQDLLAPGW